MGLSQCQDNRSVIKDSSSVGVGAADRLARVGWPCRHVRNSVFLHNEERLERASRGSRLCGVRRVDF